MQGEAVGKIRHLDVPDLGLVLERLDQLGHKEIDIVS
ncbi:MAG: hypothetical protein ACJAUG_003151 [Halioglobus sp.]|jgi:hypothetical protein